jgi:hypothetical protein
MGCTGSQLPVKTRVCTAHHTVVVRIEACGQAGPTGAALRRSGEGPVELDPAGGLQVQVGTHNALNAIAVEMAAQVVSGHHHDVSGGRRGLADAQVVKAKSARRRPDISRCLKDAGERLL